ncbi:transcriptional regulator [Microbacterium alcoholitolerans]|uniref:transcriptional regulator n=1 Tax=unclassified Microbacterium TaxID=2609290 RepID=UPI003D168E9B
MTHNSPPYLLVLHAVRLLGFNEPAAIGARAGIDHDAVVDLLRDAEQHGWVRHDAFAGLEGWSLTEEGRRENQRQLAQERVGADSDDVLRGVYRDFLPLNARLVAACTDWQLRPTNHDRLAANDHADPAWDAHVLNELDELSTGLTALVARLVAVLARFTGYDSRFDVALRRARAGQSEWVDRTGIDSCHRVWFELHEDLLATLDIDRRAEN